MLTPELPASEGSTAPDPEEHPPSRGRTGPGHSPRLLEAVRPATATRRLPDPLRLATSLWSGVRYLNRDPRLAGVIEAGPRVALFLSRSARRRTLVAQDDTVVPVRPTPVLAAQAYVDELMIALFRHPGLVPGPDDFLPAASDLAHARALFEAEGWLDDPAGYHRAPPIPDDLETSDRRTLGLSYEHVTFTSGWEPHESEPGRDRWLGHQANRTEHAWLSRAPGGGNGSWLVCVHGFGMGANPFVDLRGFRTPELHRRGVNVVVPVLPLHGLRASGRVRGEDLMTIDMVDSLHGMAQATWDVRRIIRWLRATQGATSIGVMGYSLGALVAALVASLEDDLSCVIAGIPVVDLPDLFRRHSRSGIIRLAAEHGVLGTAADEVHRVVSPLSMSCKVPLERRYVFGGLADRMSTFGHARRLWLHWDRPTLTAYQGGHVGFFWSGAARRLVDNAVDETLAG